VGVLYVVVAFAIFVMCKRTNFMRGAKNCLSTLIAVVHSEYFKINDVFT
jgi:hypothetical protein